MRTARPAILLTLALCATVGCGAPQQGSAWRVAHHLVLPPECVKKATVLKAQCRFAPTAEEPLGYDCDGKLRMIASCVKSEPDIPKLKEEVKLP